MPRQKAPKGAAAAPPSSEITDPRFSNFTTDPRFRLPSKKHTRTTIDKRFSKLLKDEDFSNTAKVDKYGRKLSSAGKKKALERLYVPDAEEEEDFEGEDDEVVAKELKKVDAGYDPARGAGFSSSSEDEEEEGGVVEVEEVAFPDMQAEQAEVEKGEVTSRIAVVNMDWDNVRAIDLMAVFQSFVPPGGKIHQLSVFKSEFGKERMEREEMEGPPREVFAGSKAEEDVSESEDDSDLDEEEKIKNDLLKEDEGQEFNSTALRQYQLERLRYYYAVLICSDKETAQRIYELTDGTEYLSSANFFDLRFIPDEVEFDGKPRDKSESVPAGYKPTEFITHALQHSKVKLTWDTNPEEAARKDAIKRAFTGSRTDIEENDLRAYLGSDSEDDEEEVVEAGVTEDNEAPKLSKKELARQKMRAALGLSDEPTVPKKSKGGPVGEMQITFTAGLTEKENGGVFENEPVIEETTAEAYIRKERERKARRKAKTKAIREGQDPDSVPAEAESENVDKDLGFDDPFFTTDPEAKSKATKSLQKEERQKKREAKAREEAANATNRAELELLMQENSVSAPEHLDHFDMNEIARAEKVKKNKKKHKGKKDGEGSKRGGLQENFEMDVGDERFGRLYESHEFAIDPSHAIFLGTVGLIWFWVVGRRKRNIEDGEVVVGGGKRRKGRRWR